MAQLIAPKSTPAIDGKTVGPTLEIVGGLHRGVTLHLESGTYRIGSTTEADIVLRDAGVAKEHGVLRVERSGVRLEAVGGDIGLNGRETLPIGRGRRVTLPLEVAFGDARLRIDDPRSKTGRRGTPSVAVLVAGGVGACVFAATVVAGGLPGNLMASLETASAGPQAAAPSATADATGSLRKPGDLTESGLSPAEDLTGRLKAAGLLSLEVGSAGDRLTVNGNIIPDEAAAWTGVQQWFDQSYAGRSTLVSNVSVIEKRRPPPALSVQAIWYGERPYLITAEGSKYYEGAFLDNGWTLQKIEENRVVLAKGEETFALTY